MEEYKKIGSNYQKNSETSSEVEKTLPKNIKSKSLPHNNFIYNNNNNNNNNNSSSSSNYYIIDNNNGNNRNSINIETLSVETQEMIDELEKNVIELAKSQEEINQL